MLLALDTATPAVTVAVHDGDRVRAAVQQVDARRHAEVLAPLVARVLADAEAPASAVDQVVVGVGPGAYTGLRVGIATASALGLAWDVPVHGACTLDALAVQAAAETEDGRDLLVVTDARRREVFWARYSPDGRRTDGPHVAAPTEVVSTGRVVGAGALALPQVFPGASAPAHPDAGWLAVGVLAGTVLRLPVSPLYLRRPDVTLPGTVKPVLQGPRR